MAAFIPSHNSDTGRVFPAIASFHPWETTHGKSYPPQASTLHFHGRDGQFENNLKQFEERRLGKYSPGIFLFQNLVVPHMLAILSS
jgi:hypothetical protein